MDTNELKSIIRKHFREVSPGQGQYVHGSWFEPHHKDSLDDLLGEVVEVAAKDVEDEDDTEEVDVSGQISRLNAIRDDIETVISELEEVTK